MKKTILSKTIKVIVNILILFGLLVGGPLLFVIGRTFAEPAAGPAVFDLDIGESKIIRVSNAYNWTNTDPAVVELNAVKAVESATVIGLKEGIATVSVGTSVGQVLTFTYKVTDKSGGGCNGGTDPDDNGSGNGGTDPGDGGSGNGGTDPGDNQQSQLAGIPGLNENTKADTVLNIDGSNWIVIKNIEMEGSNYAMLLKQTAMSHIVFEMSAGSYQGSGLQSEFTKAFTDSHIPQALMKNAVVPKLGDDSLNAVSAPTSGMALAEGIKKDIIFPLSYKEAVDWSGGTTAQKLHLSSQRWWLRTPHGDEKWYYVISLSGSSPAEGSIISNFAEVMKSEVVHLRPAIWIKYE